MAKAKRGFGQITKLPSGRIRARYTGPDGALHNAPATFDAGIDAEAWLADERRLIAAGTWVSPKAREIARHRTPAGGITFETYANAWLRDRPVKPRTRQHYRSLLDRQLIPEFGAVLLPEITPDAVRSWHALTGTATPTLRAHSYGLLRTILATAAQDRLIESNPCHIRGAGNSTRVHKIKPATLAELEALTQAMPERHRAMILLAAWCQMRFGELAELRRGDVDLKAGVIRLRRGVVRVDGGTVIGTPKTAAGIRDIAIPPHIVPFLREHMRDHAEEGKNGLLFPAATPGEHLAPSSFYGRKALVNKAGKITRSGWGYYAARAAAGREDLRFHDLRHTGAVLAAQSGATLADLMGRLGHSTPGAAMIYQHAGEDRDMDLARKLSAMVTEP